MLHAFMFSSSRTVAIKTAEFLTQETRYDIRDLIPTLEQVAEAARDDPEYDFCDS